jgi:hypothetical protein
MNSRVTASLIFGMLVSLLLCLRASRSAEEEGRFRLRPAWYKVWSI